MKKNARLFLVFFALLVASARASLPPVCDAFLGALHREDWVTAFDALRAMNPEQKLLAARAVFGSQKPMPGPVLATMIELLGPEAAARAFAEVQATRPLEVLTLGEKDEDFAARWKLLGKVEGGNEDLARRLSTSHSGARSVAFRVLKNKEQFGRNSSLFLRKSGDAEDKVDGLTASDLTRFFGKAAQNADLVRRIERNDAFWKKIFEGAPALYDDFAHSPFLLPYLYYKIRGAADPNGFAKDAEQALDSVIESAGLKSRAELDAFLAKRLKDKGIAELVDAHVTGIERPRAQGSNPAGDGTLHPTSLEALAHAYGLLGGTPKEPSAKLAEEMTRVSKQVFEPLRARGVDPADVLFHPKLQFALQMYVRGLDAEGRKALDEFFAGDGKDFPVDVMNVLGKGVVAASKDPALQSAYVVASNKGMVPEDVMLRLMVEGGDMTHTFGRSGTGPVLNARPQQIEMLRAVLQYGNLVDTKSKVLEVGYGNPSVLAALNQLVPGKTTGIDLLAPPAKLPAAATAPGPIRLLQGNVPKDGDAAKKVAEGGPYSVIYGLDIYKPSVGYGQPFRPGMSNTDYLKWAYSQLEEGGVFMALNDFKAPMPFTKDEVQAAGFEIVRWGVPRSIGAGPSALLAQAMAPSGAGDMNLFVLRKGKHDVSYLKPK